MVCDSLYTEIAKSRAYQFVQGFILVKTSHSTGKLRKRNSPILTNQFIQILKAAVRFFEMA